MKAIRKFENQKILVLGLARSGVAAAKLLHRLGAFVTVNDGKPLDKNREAQELLALGMTVITGKHPIGLLDEGFSLIVKNPGIPYSNPILEKAIERKIPIITEVEVAYDVSEADFIGITGTNGKTTTTTMIYELLNNIIPKERKALLAGNIGYPTSDVVVNATKNDVLVTELSSFQLMGINRFRPKIAVITNIFEAHIDYHGTRDNYVKAKWMIQKNMESGDYLILNGNQSELRELAITTNANVIFFNTNKEDLKGAYLLDGELCYKGERIMSANELCVPGIHNIENALAAIIVAKLNGATTRVIKETLQAFGGVAHRMEFIGEFKRRKIYNDSKATNILSTKMALSGFDHSQLILIAGGLDRGNEYEDLVSSLEELKGIVVYGQTADKLEEAAKKAGVKEIKKVHNMHEATEEAWKMSTHDSTILLSPACASWDQYENFEQRGIDFVNEIKKIVNS